MELSASPTAAGQAARVVPASSQEVGLWFVHQASPSCGSYHLLVPAEIIDDGGLGGRIEQILVDLVREYDALRVCFRPGDDSPVKWVEPAVPLDTRRCDARGIDPEELRQRIRSDSREPFDLTRAPLWRIHLYRTGERAWIVTFVMHHIAFDFWSLAMLLGELRNRLEGAPNAFSLDGDAFAEYAENQGAYLGSEAARNQITAEIERLAGAPSSIDLFGDHPRPPMPSHDGRSVPFTLSPAVSEGIRALARETGSTPYMALLTAYFVLLTRLSGQHEVLVGTPTAGRLQRRYRNAIGNFVNTVVVRGLVDEASTYRELLTASRERVLDAMRGQEIPFPWLVRELAPQRDPSRTPLYQAGFAWDRLRFGEDMGQFFLLEPDCGVELTVAGATLRPYPVPQQEGQTDLWVEMGGERDGGYVGVLRYNTDIFTDGTARELAATLVATVETLVGHADEPLQNVPRGDARQIALFEKWGSGPARELPDATLPELIRAQAERTPDATALVAGTEEWTYARLQGAIDAVAMALRAAGVSRGDRVAVMVDRGAPLVAALAGVLEAGAAYVPLDPKLPAERLEYMAEDSAARLLLTQECLRVAWLAGIPVGRLDDVLVNDAAPAPQHAVSETSADSSDVAYVLYTSGSTGRPKGVAVSHRALVNLLLAMREDTGFSAPDSLLAVTTISFDIAGLELFMPLVAGGRVIICDSDAAGDGAALASRIAESGATWMQATPTSWRMLRDAGWTGNPRLHVLCGGEELPLELAGFLAERVASLRNVYGPTETTIWSTSAVVRPSSTATRARTSPIKDRAGTPARPRGDASESTHTVPSPASSGTFPLATRAAARPRGDASESTHTVSSPASSGTFPLIDLGAPLANTQLYVLDPHGRHVEPGFPGELYIGGTGLAEGYWGRPHLTAERFRTGLPSAPDRRLYRTGDRVRWTSDGRLHYHGRLDTQVKLRGYRIELDEVEVALQAITGVAAAVVVVRDDRLVAYVVPDPGADLKAATIRATAASTLPQYMVPSVVVILDELPRTANNKIDRNRLPAPLAAADAPFEQPRDAVEITLARTWGEILNLPRVGMHDHFFELGGHSLLAVRLTAAIRAEWGIDLPVSTLLRHSTIAELAALVRREKQDTARGPLVTLRQGDADQRPLFLLHPFGGTVFCYFELSRHFPPERPIMALEAPGLDQEGEAEVSVEAMAARYIGHLGEVQPRGPYSLGGWCFGGVIAFEVARQLRAVGEEIDLIAAIDTRAPIAANIPDSADDATLLSWFARDLAVPSGKTLDIPPDELRPLGGGEAFDYILVRAAALGVLAEDADRAQVLRYFEAYLANGIALQTYTPEPAALDLLLLRAVDENADYGPALGWENLVKGSLEIVDVPGDHNSVMYPPHAAAAAKVIAGHMGVHSA